MISMLKLPYRGEVAGSVGEVEAALAVVVLPEAGDRLGADHLAVELKLNGGGVRIDCNEALAAVSRRWRLPGFDDEDLEKRRKRREAVHTQYTVHSTQRMWGGIELIFEK